MADYSTIENKSQILNFIIDSSTGEITNYYDGRPDPSVSEESGRFGSGACSTPHILTKSKIKAYPDGSLIEVNKGHIKLDPKGGGIRGPITGFSQAARRNFIHKLGTVNKTKLPLWVTLTLPDEFDVNVQQLRKFFERFRRRLERRGCSGIWRLEWKRRISGLHVGEWYPHYHLMIWGAELIEFRAWMAKAWWLCCGKLSTAHLSAGTNAKPVETWKQLCWYVSKYMAKVEDLPIDLDNIGRLWGVVNPDAIPWAELIEWTIPDKTANKLFRLMRRFAHMKTFSSRMSLKMLCDYPAQWLTASLRI